MTEEKKSDDLVESGNSNTNTSATLEAMSKLKDAISTRDSWKSKATEVTEINTVLQAQVDELTRKQSIVDGEYKSVFDGIQAENETLKTEYKTLQSVVETYETEVAEKAFSDEALKTVRHRGRAEVMLMGLAAQGKINLRPESDLAEHAEKARKLLEEMDPSLFSAENANARPSNLTGQHLGNSTGARRPNQYVPIHLLGKK